ncbi:hypothetical protein [Rhizobium sp. AG855]|uniref:hypothetical protein n=1 Tax=Rhizobium sp. AG855 TaxID=2183898 RepID=UPI000E70F9EC|nr:hypothetical protein [Rhizobium sp. AG855]RKE83261.1 hypothetical protein DFO46_0012 [Rhizobium sp. AG855]
MNQHIIDFQIYRLRHRYGAMRIGVTSTTDAMQLSTVSQKDTAIPSDTAALVTALVLRIARRRGRALSTLPGALRDALCDQVAQGDPTARLLFAWVDREQDTDAAVMEAARQPDTWRKQLQFGSKTERPIYRHHRFWRLHSSRLAELDRRRLSQLQSLLEEEIRHDR